MKTDSSVVMLFGVVLGILTLATGIGTWLGRSRGPNDTIQNLNARIRAWWVMVAVFGGAVVLGERATLVLFGFISFLALREFITLTPTRAGDHRTLFWVFFVITPLQYWMVAERWYGLWTILIPVYAFLFVPLRSALTGDNERFLERTAKIQWALMICVYCLSHAPALLQLPLRRGDPVVLLLWFVLVVQLSDVLQYVWGKTLGRRKVVPQVSPNKTWEGLIGGTISASAVGAALYRATPFTAVQAAGMALVVTALGFAGGVVMSAIKRDRGVKDFGALIEGHGGMLDRVDSLAFAAPVFFHLTRFYFTD
ncbi:MAG: phosphatidate cytidylyltransferase [Verrucomicrobia bacterium]|nr:phosphatidate cytidylyltransferase [Verrucomicrobiota bacterium]